MQSRCRSQSIFTIVNPIRSESINRKVFAHKAKVQIQTSHITARNDFHILHVAQILVVTGIGTHDTTPAISRQIIVGSKRQFQNGQALVIHIAVADRRVDVFVQHRIVTVPNKFTFVLIIQIFDIGSCIADRRSDTARRRRRIPRKTGQRIHKSRFARFKILEKSRLSTARVGVVVTARKFRFKAPVRSRLRVNARDHVHKIRHPLRRILQAQVHAPEEARIRFTAKRRRARGRTLTLVKRRNTEERTFPEAITGQRKFRSRTEQDLVIDFEQRFAFEFDRDFLVRVKSRFAQKFNLAKLVVHIIINATRKDCRARLQFFGAFRNIHAASCIHRIARARIANADDRILSFTDTFKVEAARVLRTQVRNRERIKFRHRRRRVHIAERFKAVFMRTCRRVRARIPRQRAARQPHFTRIRTGSILLKDRRIAREDRIRRRIDKA